MLCRFCSKVCPHSEKEKKCKIYWDLAREVRKVLNTGLMWIPVCQCQQMITDQSKNIIKLENTKTDENNSKKVVPKNYHCANHCGSLVYDKKGALIDQDNWQSHPQQKIALYGTDHLLKILQSICLKNMKRQHKNIET